MLDGPTASQTSFLQTFSMLESGAVTLKSDKHVHFTQWLAVCAEELLSLAFCMCKRARDHGCLRGGAFQTCVPLSHDSSRPIPLCDCSAFRPAFECGRSNSYKHLCHLCVWTTCLTNMFNLSMLGLNLLVFELIYSITYWQSAPYSVLTGNVHRKASS